MQPAHYNSIFRMTGLQRHFWGTILAFLLLASSVFASNWTAPATELAKSIASVTGPSVVTLTITNSCSLTKTDVADIQHTFESQLRSAGIRLSAASNTENEVHVTLSENLQGYVWIAEIKRADQSRVEMIAVPRTEAPAAAYSGPNMTVHKTLLWSQSAQILDAYQTGNRLVLLDTDAVSTFTMNSGKWQRQQSLAIIRGHTLPRDVRGLMVPAKDHLADAYLPGTVCNVTADTTNAIACHDGDDPWPLGAHAALFNSARNYFTGALVPASARPLAPFYSLVSLDRPGYTLSLFTGIDGRVHLNDQFNERSLPAPTTSDWGSDIAALKTQCGSGTQILVTNSGDDTVTDSLRAFEIPDHNPVQVSAAADFPGPITALWTHGDSATVVAHNLQTGSYEAYSVSITCNQ